MVEIMAARIPGQGEGMSSVIQLDRRGYRLGTRLERRLVVSEKSSLDSMDDRLKFFGRKLFFKENDFIQFGETLESIHRFWDLAHSRSDEELGALWCESHNAANRCACIAEFILRETGLKAHDEQLYAAWLLRDTRCLEMATGEGKSLVSALTAAWVASEGVRVHIITTNEYLVSRDAEIYEPVFKRAGLISSYILKDQSDHDRREAYKADVVYVTGKQAGFDYLRDCVSGHNGHGRLRNSLKKLMPQRGNAPIQCGLEFALVDEIDSVLIDEARTPLILASAASERAVKNEQAEAAVALGLADLLEEYVHFEIDTKNASVALTPDGEKKLIDLAEKINGPWLLARFRNEKVRQALHVMHVLEVDVDYIVRNDSIELIDQSTGRAMPDRNLPHGMQQMLQAHVGCSITAEAKVQLSITFRGLFSRYRHLCGMTGTLKGLEREIHADFGMHCQVIPTHSPSSLITQKPLVFRKRGEQVLWVVQDVKKRIGKGQPVLLGVRSVEECASLSTVLSGHRIKHHVINAANDAEEARVIAKAGVAGTVTIATNMAGRGTDIPLDDAAIKAGGLHVVSLSLNESFRVERQLFGRAGRQGQPGSCQRVLSMDDPLLKQNLSRTVRKFTAYIGIKNPNFGHLFGNRLVAVVVHATERRHETQRRNTWRLNQDIERRLAYGIHRAICRG